MRIACREVRLRRSPRLFLKWIWTMMFSYFRRKMQRCTHFQLERLRTVGQNQDASIILSRHSLFQAFYLFCSILRSLWGLHKSSYTIIAFQIEVLMLWLSRAKQHDNTSLIWCTHSHKATCSAVSRLWFCKLNSVQRLVLSCIQYAEGARKLCKVNWGRYLETSDIPGVWYLGLWVPHEAQWWDEKELIQNPTQYGIWYQDIYSHCVGADLT